MDEIRNQFKNQTLASLVASSLQVVGGRVFPDSPSIEGLDSFKAVVQSWQGVHVPTYGQPIPTTGEAETLTGTGVFIDASGNAVKRVHAITLKNSGEAAPIVVGLTQAGVSLIALPDGGVITPAGTIIISGPFFVDASTPISVSVTSGTPTDLITAAVVHKVVQ